MKMREAFCLVEVGLLGAKCVCEYVHACVAQTLARLLGVFSGAASP